MQRVRASRDVISLSWTDECIGASVIGADRDARVVAATFALLLYHNHVPLVYAQLTMCRNVFFNNPKKEELARASQPSLRALARD